MEPDVLRHAERPRHPELPADDRRRRLDRRHLLRLRRGAVDRRTSCPEAPPRACRACTRHRGLGRSSTAPIDASGPISAATSTDGGQTWSTGTEVTNLGGGYADDVRCCLFGADIDAVSGRMHVAWHGGVGDTDPVYESFSDDGTQWSSPVRVSRGDVSGIQNVNVDVSARGGKVYVSYGKRRHPEQDGGFVQQQLVASTDGGAQFGAPMPIGPVSALKYAAQAGWRTSPATTSGPPSRRACSTSSMPCPRNPLRRRVRRTTK